MKLALDPETALRALPAVDPDAEPTDDEPADDDQDGNGEDERN